MARQDVLLVPTLRQALEGATVPELRDWAKMLYDQPPSRKGELVALLVEYLSETDNLRSILGALDDLQRAAVAEAVHGDGQLHPQVFAAKYGQRLALEGWLKAWFRLDMRLPEDLRDRLRPLVAPPPPPQLRGLPQIPPELAASGAQGSRPARTRLTEHAAQADLLAVLRLCDKGTLRCSATTRRPTAATVKAVAEVLAEGDFYDEEPIAAFAWPLLVQAGGLAELAGERLQLTARGRRALRAPAPATLCQLWQRWLHQGLLDEFSRVEAIKGQRGSGGRNLTAAGPRRQAVARALADAPVGTWVPVDDFFAYIIAAGHDFEVVRNKWKVYVGDPMYGSLGYEDQDDWKTIQGRFVLCLLLEYAATLGLIDIVYVDPAGARDDFRQLWGGESFSALSRYDGLRLFRLNALGAYCLGQAAEYRASAEPSRPQGPRLRVLPNLDVVYLGQSMPATDRLLLEQYAEPRSAGVWALQRRKLLAAVARGTGIDDLERLLRERVEPPLPDALLALLAEVRERSGQLIDRGTVRLVECAEDDLAKLLAHDRRLRALCFPVGERLLAVPLDQEDRFRRALWEVGYALAPAAPPPARA